MCKLLKLKYQIKAVYQTQKGGVSPFMFGMLISVTILSGLTQYWSQQELNRIASEKQRRTAEKAEDIKAAVENKILTENSETTTGYNTSFSLDDLKGNLTTSTGKTNSGRNVYVSSETQTGAFGETGSRIRISTSDDAFKIQQLEENSTEALNLSGTDKSIAVIDTTDVREQQIKQSKEYLEMEAAQLFRYYTTNDFSFPSDSEYKAFNRRTNLKDAWGNDFIYRKVNNKKATLTFSTPWGYRFTKTLSME